MDLVKRKNWFGILQIIVTIILIGLLLNKVQWTTISKIVLDINVKLIGLSLLLIGVIHLINVFRWYLILPKGEVRFFNLISYYGAGLFTNYFLPTGFGGDAVRIALLSQNTSFPLSFYSVIVDRLLGFAALIMLFLLGLQIGIPGQLVFDLSQFSQFEEITPLIVISIVIAVMSLFLLLIKSFKKIRRRISVIVSNVKSIYSKELNTDKQVRIFILILGIAFLSQFTLIIVYWLVFTSFSIEIPFAASLWLVLTISLLLFFPISINGIGVNESLVVIILGQYGVSTTSAIGAALVIRTLSIFISMIGGFVFLITKKQDIHISTITDNLLN